MITTTACCAACGQTEYDFSVFGPNGFFRTFKGTIAVGSANIASSLIYDIQSNGIILGIHNHARTPCEVEVSAPVRIRVFGTASPIIWRPDATV